MLDNVAHITPYLHHQTARAINKRMKFRHYQTLNVGR
jgi:hypothetical protein